MNRMMATESQSASDETAKSAAFPLASAFILENGPIVLGLPKGRVTLPIAHTFTALDKDWDAIDAAHSGQTLFDFGLGRRYSRFGVEAERGYSHPPPE